MGECTANVNQKHLVALIKGTISDGDSTYDGSDCGSNPDWGRDDGVGVSSSYNGDERD